MYLSGKKIFSSSMCEDFFDTHARLVWEGVISITSQTSLAEDIYTNATD